MEIINIASVYRGGTVKQLSTTSSTRSPTCIVFNYIFTTSLDCRCKTMTLNNTEHSQFNTLLEHMGLNTESMSLVLSETCHIFSVFLIERSFTESSPCLDRRYNKSFLSKRCLH